MGNDWIEWKGDICPVEGNVEVQIRYRDETPEQAENSPLCFLASSLDWFQAGGNADIVAYRVVE